MHEEKKKQAKARKGWLAVRVGLEDDDGDGEGGFRRFMIPITYLYHPQFTRLLEEAHETYGYHSSGPLKLPCSVDDFLHVRWMIERETCKSSSDHGQCQHRRHHRNASFSFHAC